MLPRGLMIFVGSPGFAASPYSHFVVANVSGAFVICCVIESFRFVAGSYVFVVTNARASVTWVRLLLVSYWYCVT